ncbi:MAG: hypothetical protein JNK23_04585 [Opitutaceae bacterium]|nr:hypothetical protein [Opitutaceae bacterium]
MKFSSVIVSSLSVLLGGLAVRAQPANPAAFGSTVTIWSSHTTVRERIDAGVNERIELWNRAWIVSPTGATYIDTNNYGLGGSDGFSTTTVTLNEVGRWAWWTTDGGAIDSFRFGDSASTWYMFPHNPPNGVGYGGAGTALGSFIDVAAAPTFTLTTGTLGSGSVSGGGSYAAGATATVTATPFGGSTFSGWQGALSGSANPASLTMDANKSVSAVFAAANAAPTIAWTSAPANAASGQNYTVSAHGHDADGNLTQVNVWKNGAPFAFGGGGNGFDSDSGNATFDSGPAAVTFTANAVDANGATSPTISHAVTISAANRSPTIAWTSTPGSVASGQSYTVSARGHDDDGNLAQVNVWKDGSPFAFAGGGNGTDGDSGNATSDTGPATITFTAQAVDANGATSAVISQTVSIAAANTAPTIAWNTTPGSVASGQSYTISAHGHDADGNLAQVNVWKNGGAFAFAGGGNGTDGDSGNTTSDSGPAAITFTANAVDSLGATSATISQTVAVTAPAAVSASISASPTTATAPGASTITWASANASSVSVSGPGLSSAAASGSQAVNGLPVGTHTFTITAQGNGGPVTQTASVTVAPAASVTASISASPTSATAPGASTIMWSSANATAVSVSGTGLSSTATSGSQNVTGLAAGSHDYTITAQGPGGPMTQIATVVVSSAASVSGSIAASPASGIAPLSTTVSWSTANATAVSISGPSLNSTAANGAQNVSGLTVGTHTFTLTAQGPGVPITRSTSVTVSPAAPTVSAALSASPTTATAPGATTLTWSTANATAVSVSGPGLASTATNGTQTVTRLAAGTHVFTLTAQGNGGPLTRTATVTVNPPSGLAAAISVSPATINVGGSATLTWSTANASSVHVTGFGITGSPYQSNPNFTVNIGGLPPGQSTWTLIAEGPGGPVTRTATIAVNSIDGFAGSLTVSPTVIYSNQSATLAWTSSGANFRWIHGQLPSYNGVSIYPAPTSGSSVIPALPPGDYSFVFEYGPGAFSATRGAYAYLTVLGVDRTVTASVSPAGTGVVTGAGTYPEGASATLTATPDATHVFTGWSGDLAGTANPLTFTVGAQNYALTANFALRTYSVVANVAPAGAGSVSGAGTYNAGATAILTATPNATHAFSGWTGDVMGTANPLVVTVNGNTSVVANFVATGYALTTAATAGGSVTPGGVYPAGSIVTVGATPDATHRFFDWSGDASGAAPSIAVTMDRAKFVQANFVPKTAQTIAFDPPGDRAVSSPPFALVASASSGLPVSFSLLGGPATLTGATVQLTGAGSVSVQANQPGDAFFLPAPPVTRTFNAVAAATLKYRGEARTLLRDESTSAPPPYVSEKP